MPFQCHRCGKYFCDKHRLPEDHKCKGLGNKNIFMNLKKEHRSQHHEHHREEEHRSSFQKFLKKVPAYFSFHLNKRTHRKYDYKRLRYYFWRAVFLAISLFVLIWSYKNISSLNENKLWIIQLGGALVIVSLIFLLKFSYGLLKEFFNWHKRQRKWIKFIVVVLILFLLWQGYQNRDSLFGQVSGVYRGISFSEVSPISLNSSSGGSFLDSVFSGPKPEAVNLTYKTYPVGKYNLNQISLSLYGGYYNYFIDSPHEYTYYSSQPPTGWENDYYKMFLDNKYDNETINTIVNETVSATGTRGDNAVRALILFVQKIPYDYLDANSINSNIKYPYETLYLDRGVCADKSILLAKLLSNLGYGVALLDYSSDNHMAVGIKCPVQYSLDSSGYCFIESTTPTIITDNEGDYPCTYNPSQNCKLSDSYSIIVVSNGKSFDSVAQEYNDAQTFEKLDSISSKNNGYLSQSQYRQWENLVKKYDIQISS